MKSISTLALTCLALTACSTGNTKSTPDVSKNAPNQVGAKWQDATQTLSAKWNRYELVNESLYLEAELPSGPNEKVIPITANASNLLDSLDMHGWQATVNAPNATLITQVYISDSNIGQAACDAAIVKILSQAQKANPNSDAFSTNILTAGGPSQNGNGINPLSNIHQAQFCSDLGSSLLIWDLIVKEGTLVIVAQSTSNADAQTEHSRIVNSLGL